jgi:hypothetical protein
MIFPLILYSQNKLTDLCAKSLSQLLITNCHLTVLFIRWNHFTAKGAIALAHGLSGNEGLQILDASFNAFGSYSISGGNSAGQP